MKRADRAFLLSGRSAGSSVCNICLSVYYISILFSGISADRNIKYNFYKDNMR